MILTLTWWPLYTNWPVSPQDIPQTKNELWTSRLLNVVLRTYRHTYIHTDEHTPVKLLRHFMGGKNKCLVKKQNFKCIMVIQQQCYSIIFAMGEDDIGHKPYRPRPFRPKKYRPQTISATVNDHIGHILVTNHIGHAIYTWCPDTFTWPAHVHRLFMWTIWNAHATLLHREAKVTNLKIKMLSETKQQRLQKDKTAHMQHQLWKVCDEYRAGSRSVNGVLRACARIYLSV